MSYQTSPEMLLRTLTEPRRNNYFYGKMLDVPQLRLEQDYGKKKQWLMNRLSLGTGVLCGLGVALEHGKLRVDQGVAIDPLGREIIVPGSFTIDPFAPKAPCERGWKGPAHDPAAPPKGPATLWVCYSECLTDQVPSAISDCHGQQRCDAGTIVESFKFRITEGAVDGPAFDNTFCVPIHEIFKKPAQGGEDDNGQAPVDPHAALCALLGNDCGVVDGPVCVPIATFNYSGEAEISDLKVCEARNRVYSNQVLLELILCLMARVEECCGKGPAVDEMLKVTGISFNNGGMARTMSTADLHNDLIGMVLPADFKPVGMTVSFNKPVLRESVTMGTDPQDIVKASFIVEKIKLNPVGYDITDVITGSLGFENGDKDITLKFDHGALKPGLYFGQLNGSPDSDHERPAITDATQALELDAESAAFPSGDGTEGGSFDFFFTVEGEPQTETLRVMELEFQPAGPFSPQRLTDADLANGRTGMVLPANFYPVGLKITFNKPLDLHSITLNHDPSDRERHSFQFDRVKLHPAPDEGFDYEQVISGYLDHSDGDTVVTLKLERGAMQPGNFLGRLYGDADPILERPAIVDAAEHRGLDGEPDKLPSGRGDDGGLFSFWVTLEAEAVETLRVTEVETLRVDDPSQPHLEKPSDGLVWQPFWEPRGVRVRFNMPVDVEGLVVALEDQEINQSNIVVAKSRDGISLDGVVPCKVTPEDEKTILIETHQGVFRTGRYVVLLRADLGERYRPIMARDTGSPLDGEPDALPSGNGAEGGTFRFPIVVRR